MEWATGCREGRKWMFEKLKRKFIIIYTVTAGAILTLVVMVAFFSTKRQENESYLQMFQNNFYVISNQLQTENFIRSQWILEQEERNHLIICIEDNGQPLMLPRSRGQAEYRDRLVQKMKTAAKEENVDTGVRPISEQVVSSSVKKIWDENGRLYYGQVLILKAEKGYRSLILLKAYKEVAAKRVLLFVVSDMMGILALFFISRWFVGNSLRPVEESRRKQNEFIHAASHELRSPLAVMKANLSAIKTMPERREDCMAVLDRECSRLARLVEDLLILASKDTGRQHLEKKKVDVENVIVEIYESYLPLCEEKNVGLCVELPDTMLPEVEADKERIRQILCIYVDNAMRFSPSGGQITLGIKKSKGSLHKGRKKVVFYVKDQGPGVKSEDRERVFERFYQADETRGEKEHFGLGLSIAKELAMQGGAEVFCQNAQEGAVFCLWL